MRKTRADANAFSESDGTISLHHNGIEETIRLHKYYNISGVDSANLLSFKEFKYICM